MNALAQFGYTHFAVCLFAYSIIAGFGFAIGKAIVHLLAMVCSAAFTGEWENETWEKIR